MRFFDFLKARFVKSVVFVVGTLLIGGQHARTANGAPHILTNGPGDGTVSVGVDGFGAFGSSSGGHASNAVYDPVGELEPAGTVYESAVFISGPPAWLSAGDLPDSANPLITGDSRHATSTFVHNFLRFQLEQTLIDSFDNDGIRLGTILQQDYHITNLAEVPNSVALTRYIDGDLQFDNSIDDGGGRLIRAGTEILYETDAASGSAASTTFVGITASASLGGIPNPSGRFEIAEYSDLQDKIGTGGNLNNTIQADTDGDGFIDAPYDVTMALSTFLQFPAFGQITFSTQTLFGNAVPPSPGSSEALPLLPANNEPPFVFEIEPPGPGNVNWYDPVSAVGYDYLVTAGSNFESVVMPSTAVVPQTGDYQLELFDGSGFVVAAQLSPGESFMFGPGGVDRFRITGINAGLDPNDSFAFPTGISFVGTSPTQFSMTPLVIPEPGTALLAMFGLAIAYLNRRKIPSFGRSCSY